MGIVSSNAGNEEANALGNIPQNLRKMELKIDFSKPEHPSLKQILFWSLAEVRQVYETFQRRSRGNVAFMDKTLFCKIVPFTRTNAIFIFENFSRNNKYLSIYEFICVITICSYTHYINKIHFLYILFDLDCNGGISLNELLIIFKSIVMGYCKLTQSQMPSYQNLEKFAKIMFLKSDIQADNSLELKEIIEWVDQNQTAKELFLRYEPQYSVKENYDIFRFFKKYTEEQAEELLRQINKANKDEYFYNDLGKLMGGKGQNRYLESTQSIKNQQKRFLPSISKPNINNTEQKIHEMQQLDEELDDDFLDRALDQHAKKYEKKVDPKPSTEKLQNNSKTFSKNQSLPGLRRKINLKDMNKEFGQQISKNIIIIKGDTLTKQDVFKLKEYFDQLSDKNPEITIKEFTKAFQKKEHMKRVCASIFNFLDDKQLGKITFHDLLAKLYPSLNDPLKKSPKTQSDLKTIANWLKSYQKTFNQENININNNNNLASNNLSQQQQDLKKKKRVLPKSSMVRVREIFGLLDEGKKGFLDQADLQKHFQGGFSQKEVEKLFQDYDADQDGRIVIEDFVRMILPKDYVIEEDKEE